MAFENWEIQFVCVCLCFYLALFVLEDCEEIDAVSSPLSPGTSVKTRYRDLIIEETISLTLSNTFLPFSVSPKLTARDFQHKTGDTAEHTWNSTN